jgi:uncharacterized protein (DUF2164 family)
MAPRTNSARRTTDRMEDMAAWVLIAAGLLVLLLSYGVGAQFYNQGLERVQVESAERAPAEARLLSDAQLNSSVSSRSSTVMAPATWQDRVGAAHDGFVMVPRGLRAGGKVAIWTDVSGANVPAPMTSRDALLIGFIGGGVALAGGIGLLFGLWVVVRRVTMAANCARWEDEWREVAPNWTHGTRD